MAENLLKKNHADFITSGVSISLASWRPGHPPTMSRGMGCKVLDDGRQVGVFILRSQSAALLDCIRTSRRVANVFSLPSTNRTLQLKGADAEVQTFEVADWPVVEAHLSNFMQEVRPLGLPESVVRAVLACNADDLVTVVYSPNAVFSQTPGPNAGERLGGA